MLKAFDVQIPEYEIDVNLFFFFKDLIFLIDGRSFSSAILIQKPPQCIEAKSR